MHSTGVRGSVRQGRGAVGRFGATRLRLERRGAVSTFGGSRSGLRGVGGVVDIGRRVLARPGRWRPAPTEAKKKKFQGMTKFGCHHLGRGMAKSFPHRLDVASDDQI